MKTRRMVTIFLFLGFLLLSVMELAGKWTVTANRDAASVLYVRSVKTEVNPVKERKRIDYSTILDANSMSKDG